MGRRGIKRGEEEGSEGERGREDRRKRKSG